MAPILPLQLRAARHSMAARPPAAAGPTSSKVVRSLLFPFSHTGERQPALSCLTGSPS